MSTQETRVRQLARKQALSLVKSRSRHRERPDFGGFMIVDDATNVAVAGASPFAFSLSLAEAEEWLR